MKKPLLLLCAMLSATTVVASPVYEVITNDTIACSSSPSEGCKHFQRGFRFEAYNWGQGAKTVRGSPLATESDTGSPPVYNFDGRDVAPIFDANGNMTEPTCRWPEGGVTQRVVEGTDGQLYLKRIQIIVKCVNGKMMAIQRALN